MCWKVLDHPPYSPDLLPYDFHEFGPLKNTLKGCRFWLYKDTTLQWCGGNEILKSKIFEDLLVILSF
jgi:hypothetical protein